MQTLHSINLRVVLASARSPDGVKRVDAEVKASDTVCYFNGAWVGKLSTRETLKEVRMARMPALEAIHEIGRSPIWFDLDQCYALASDQAIAPRRIDVTGDVMNVVRSVGEIPGAPLKLLAAFPSDRIFNAITSLSEMTTGCISVAQSGPGLIEIVDPMARKDLAASFVAQN